MASGAHEAGGCGLGQFVHAYRALVVICDQGPIGVVRWMGARETPSLAKASADQGLRWLRSSPSGPRGFGRALRVTGASPGGNPDTLLAKRCARLSLRISAGVHPWLKA